MDTSNNAHWRKTMIRTLSTTALFLALATGSAQASLIFQMDFNEADGTQTFVDAAGGVTGSASAGAGFSSIVAPSNSGGFSGSFDGAGADNWNFGNVTALNGLTDMTITAWIRPTNTPGGPTGSARIVSKRATSTGNPGFDFYYHNTDSELEFVNDLTLANGGGSFTGNGQWTFVAVTYDGDSASNNVNFYTGDGTTLSAADTTSLNGGAFTTTTSSFLIGNFSGGTRTFEGLIDNVRIYDSVEDAASLASIMQFDDAIIPEPGSMALVTVGGLLIAMRSRRSA